MQHGNDHPPSIEMIKTVKVIILILAVLAPWTASAGDATPRLAHTLIASPALITPQSAVKEELDRRGSKEFPVIIEIASVPVIQVETSDKTEKVKDYFSSEWWLIYITAILALFTGALFGATVYLGKEAKKTSDRQEIEMKDSLAIAKESADAARLSADSAVALELPLFVIENISISQNFQTCDVHLGNHGRTPAIITRNCLVTKLDMALPLELRYPINDVEKVSISRIVGPADEYTISRKSSISPTEWLDIYASKTILWVYGYLEYIDFLKKKRRTGFCVAFLPRPDIMYPSSVSTKGEWVQEGPASYSYDKILSE